MATSACRTTNEHLQEQDEIKPDPELHDEDTENAFFGFDNSKRIPSTADVGAPNLWTSKATYCLISHYKKYRPLVGQTTKLRTLRDMFEMMSVAMQKYGFYYSARKCENKWRVLERKYDNLVFRERLKKPGRIRNYGHWEYRRLLDEIFKERKRNKYLSDQHFPPPSGSAKIAGMMVPKHFYNSNEASSSESSRLADQTGIVKSMLTHFGSEMTKNFSFAERNNERRHRERLEMSQRELEVQASFLNLKEQKLELQQSQLIAAAQHLVHHM